MPFNYDAMKIFEPDTQQYQRLKELADKLTSYSSHMIFTVDTVYFDKGQEWKWTTILAHFAPYKNKNDIRATWQAVTPCEQADIIFGDFIDRMCYAFDDIMRKYQDYNEEPGKYLRYYPKKITQKGENANGSTE